MRLKLGSHQFKIDSYKFKMLAVTHLVTNKKITKKCTEKEIGGSKNGTPKKTKHEKRHDWKN